MTIGILGGGQLGRMLALAGYPLGFRFRAMDASDEAVSAHLSDFHRADFSDEQALLRFIDGVDVVTYEFENVPIEAVRFIEQFKPVHPSSHALGIAQDRLLEKDFFRSIGIPTPEYHAVDSLDELRRASALLGFPCVLKTRRMGYDGKGQIVLRSAEQLNDAWRRLGHVPLILEQYIRYNHEYSIIAARSVSGAFRAYPLAENTHAGGILRRTRCPVPEAATGLEPRAVEAIRAAMTALHYVGVLAIEFFEVHGQLLANEMAPRVHNSGHWTIDATPCSQFENHLRAITDLPLGETAPFAHAVMENLIGSIPEVLPVLATPRAHLHLYGKLPLPGRKLGHITTLADTAGQALLVADALRKRIGLPASTPTTHEPSAAEGVNTDVA